MNNRVARQPSQQWVVLMWALRQAGTREQGKGYPGAPGLALGTPVVLKPHVLPLFTEGGRYQQGCGGSAGQNH